MNSYDEQDNNVYDEEDGLVYDDENDFDFDEEDFDVIIEPANPQMAGTRIADSITYDEYGNCYDEDNQLLGKIKKFGNYLSPGFQASKIKRMIKARSSKAKKVKKSKKAAVANSLLQKQELNSGPKVPLITGGKSSIAQAVFGVGKANKAIRRAVETKSIVVPLYGIEDINVLTDNIMLQEQSYNQIVQDIRIAVSGAAKKRTTKGFMPALPLPLTLSVLNSKFFGVRVRMSDTYTLKKYDATKFIVSGVGCDTIEFVVIPKEGCLVQEFVCFSINLSQSVGRIVPATQMNVQIPFDEAIPGTAFFVEGYNGAHCPNVDPQ